MGLSARNRILTLLAHSAPLSAATIGMICKVTWRLYPVLARLEAEKRISSEWKAGPYPRRRLYRLASKNQTTDSGDR